MTNYLGGLIGREQREGLNQVLIQLIHGLEDSHIAVTKHESKQRRHLLNHDRTRRKLHAISRPVWRQFPANHSTIINTFSPAVQSPPPNAPNPLNLRPPTPICISAWYLSGYLLPRDTVSWRKDAIRSVHRQYSEWLREFQVGMGRITC